MDRQSCFDAHGNSLNPSGIQAVPSADAWKQSLQQHRNELTSLASFLNAGRSGPRREWWLDVERVSQLDALRLDGEMRALLREQLRRMLALVPARLLSRYDAELELLLDALLWRFSVWLGRSTPACALLNLRFRSEAESARLSAAGQLPVRTGLEGPGLSAQQKVAFLLLTAGARYASARLSPLLFSLRLSQQHPHPQQQQQAASERGLLRRLLASSLPAASAALSLASCANLLLFLRFGRFRTLAERCLRIRTVYLRPHMSRAIAFDYMNRQLVWTELSEVLLLVLPLLSSSALASWKTLLWPRASAAPSGAAESAGCPICSAAPVAVPFRAQPCRHVFCYYCIRTRAAARPGFQCPVCREAVASIVRVQA